MVATPTPFRPPTSPFLLFGAPKDGISLNIPNHDRRNPFAPLYSVALLPCAHSRTESSEREVSLLGRERMQPVPRATRNRMLKEDGCKSMQNRPYGPSIMRLLRKGRGICNSALRAQTSGGERASANPGYWCVNVICVRVDSGLFVGTAGWKCCAKH